MPRKLLTLLAALVLTAVLPAIAQADTVFDAADAPGGDAIADSPIEVGMKFSSTTNGYITALRFYKQSNNTGTHTGHLWNASGQQLAAATFTNESGSGWQQVDLATPVQITANTTYVVSYYAAGGRFGFSPGYFSSGKGTGALRAPSDSEAGGQGVFHYGASAAFPDQTWGATNYWVDAVFATTPPADTSGPSVTSVTPAADATDVDPATKPKVVFSEPLTASTVNATTVKLTNDLGATIAATVAYDAATRTATLTPSASLAGGRTYTVTATTGVKDSAGNAMAANFVSSFSTPAACPCSVFKPSEGPLGNLLADQPIELGMKIRPSENGWITALKFYKQDGNTGVHTGHLWAADGTELAAVTFTNETASGWQTAQLPSPVQVSANTTYITSYFSPNGRFSFDSGYFVSGVNRTPLGAPSDSLAGGNGVFHYGATSGFPNATFGATNYWVDASFERTKPADTRPPGIASYSPAANAKRVDAAATVKVTFDEPIDRVTVNTGSLVLKDKAGNPVSGPVTFDDATRTATLTPTQPLKLGETYTATVKSGTAGVTDLAGNRLTSDISWTFSTSAACPCSIFDATEKPAATDAVHDQPIEVGVRFKSAEDGYITGLRFYKQGNNTGTHVGHLWSADGTLLASATFSGESASGWQSLTLANPVAVTKNTLYIASYYSVGGNFPFDQNYFTQAKDGGMLTALASTDGGNGVYHYGASGFPTQSFNGTNYWVDAVFDRTVPPDTTGPSVMESAPSASEGDVDINTNVTVTFDEQLTAASMSSSTFTLKNDAGALVPTTVSYNAQTRVATLHPTAPLAYKAVYTVTLKGGASGVKDASGNPLADDKTWTFTTIGQPPTEGPGGPLLVQTDPDDKFGTYYAEILRSEGLNDFAVSSADITAAALANTTTIVLADRDLSTAEVTVLTNWVNAGGNLIAMRPDKKLASLLGLTDQGTTLTEGYMKVDSGSAAGAGLYAQSMQYHGTADRYALNGASAVASLYSDASTATAAPAVSLRDIGTSGGQAASFSYDLARSVIYTRQGNPAWAGQKRDGLAPLSIRPDDLFYGAKAGDVKPDWVDPNRFEVPQADEQQRLLANLITQMNLDKAPLPRFWYLPRGDKAAIVLTGDDHAVGKTPEYFDRLKAASPAGCSVADWECVRATSYVYAETQLTQQQAKDYSDEGFEIGLHLNTGCLDFTPDSIDQSFTTQLGAFRANWPDLKPPVSNRTHCIVWSDWASQAKAERAHGIRFDANYYYKGPSSWVKKPGLMTGSGFPQRFGDLDGSMIDVYQSMTQVSDEMDDILPTTTQIHTLLDNALGSKEYWGVFDVILHADFGDHTRLNDLVADAQRRGVPIVTSAQMLSWIDGRNASSFSNIAYSGGTMTFNLTAHSDARGLEAMLPARSAAGPLAKLTRAGQPVSWTRRKVKGVDYVVFNGVTGAYQAVYQNDTTAPAITAVAATADTEGHATISWKTDEPSTSLVQYGRTTALGFESEDTVEVSSHSIELTGLAPGATYYYRVNSTDTAGNAGASPASPATSSFTTAAGTLTDSRTSEFAAGTQSGTYAGDTLAGTDGEVTLTPTVGDEFNGSALSSGWTTSPWSLGGSSWLANGAAFADSAVTYTNTLFSGPRTLEFTATFQAVNEQAVGLGVDLSNYPYAIIGTGAQGEPFGIYARSGAFPGEEGEAETALPDVSLYVPHRYKIEWAPSAINYYVDGVLKATHNVAIAQEMRPVISDQGLFGAATKVDWVRMNTYTATSGTFQSRVLDSGPGAQDWQTMTVGSTKPTGTAITYQTRSGATPIPDATWSAWAAVGTGGVIPSPNSRYLQYRAILTSNSSAQSPTLDKVQVSFTAGTDRAPVSGTVTVSPTAPKTNHTLTATPSGFSDPDGDPITYSYTWLRNGTVINGATTSKLNLNTAGYGDRGDKIRVSVQALDGKGAASDPATKSVIVDNTAPTAGSSAITPAPPSTNDLVRATPSGFADLDGDALTYTYQWLLNGVAIPGATNRTLDLSLAGNGNAGDTLAVDIKAVDTGGLTSPAARATATIGAGNSTPVAGTVKITPAGPKTNDVITATVTGFRDPDGDALNYTYVWSRNGTVIAGETSATLNLATAGRGDRGDAIKVDVYASDPGGLKSDTVSATDTVATTNPTAGTVSIRPSAPATNDVVAASVSGFSDLDGDTISYEYQWSRNGEIIPGATGRSLNLATAGNGNAGDVISVSVKANDGHDGLSTPVSANVTVIAGNGHPVASYGFEEAAGNVAVDQYGSNDGTITGATRVNNGRFGRALDFEDDSSIVDVPDDSSLHLGSGMTLEAWVRPTAASGWRTVMFKEASGGPAYSLYSSNDDSVPHMHIGNEETSGVSGTDQIESTEWTHLAATYDGNIMRLYVNGTLVSSKARPGEISPLEGPLTIGANHVWGEKFRGLIDEVRVYNRPLTREEILTDKDSSVVPNTPAPPTDTSPDVIGKFAAPQAWPITPVHLATLADGRIAAWDGFEAAVNSEHTWNPWTNAFDEIRNGGNLFCAGHIQLLDGRLLVVGGHIQSYEGTKETNLFTPTSNTWARGADMSVARWYPSATGLPDGRVFVISGDNITLGDANSTTTPVPLINAADTLPSIYNPQTDTWQDLPAAGRKMPLYPFMFVLPNGKLFDAGPDKVTRTLDLSTNQWTVVDTSTVDGQSAVMYRPGKIMKSGTWSDPEFPGRQTTNAAQAIDFNVASPHWADVAPMKYRRSMHTLTVLPDGKVLATGGQTGTDGVDESTGVLPAEMWDPDTNTWTTMASSKRPRLYHSSAVLLADGRVLLAGGGAYGDARNEKSGELFSPPYLFKGARPVVANAPAKLHYGQSFTLDTPDAGSITKVSLLRMGSVTHNFDFDQRFQWLDIQSKTADSVTIGGPTNANIAPPGRYLVYVLNANGVPSGGQMVTIDGAADTTAPSAPAGLTASATADGANLSWTASTDNVGVTEYRVFRSTTPGFTPSSSNRVARVASGTTWRDAGLSAGTYQYVVKAIDAAGNLSAISARVNVTVAGDTTAPTVALSAPADNASVSATVPVSATASDNNAVASVQFQLDGANLGDPDTASPYTLSWDTTQAADGKHTLTAIAKDATGNAKTSAARTVTVRNTGLVAAYGFEDGTGTTAKDVMGAHNGTLTGGAAWTATGRFGKALSFDGVDDSVTVPADATLDLTTAGTIEAWVKPTALDSFRSVVQKERVGAAAYALFANTDAAHPAARVFTTAGLEAAGSSPLLTTTWTHLAMTWDSTTLRIFVDGAEVSSQAAPGPLTTTSGVLRIGGNGLGSEWFSGLIDEVRVYNRALSAQEIATTLNQPLPG